MSFNILLPEKMVTPGVKIGPSPREKWVQLFSGDNIFGWMLKYACVMTIVGVDGDIVRPKQPAGENNNI